MSYLKVINISLKSCIIISLQLVPLSDSNFTKRLPVDKGVKRPLTKFLGQGHVKLRLLRAMKMHRFGACLWF